MMKKQVLSITFSGYKYPIAEIKEYRDQILVRFIHTSHHLTLHRCKIIEREGDRVIIQYGYEYLEINRKACPDLIIFTSYDEHKTPSIWDNLRSETAKHFGYKDPLRHAKYHLHTLLRPVLSPEGGYYLCGRRMILKVNSRDNNYLKNDIQIGESKTQDPMLEIILSTNNSVYSGLGLLVSTGLGNLYFRIQKT